MTPTLRATIDRSLLAIKLAAVAVYFGGLAAVTFIWIGGAYASMPPEDPRRAWLVALVGWLMVWLVVPALVVAILMGIALLLRSPRRLLKMRWLRVKLLALIILIPSAHFWSRAQVLVLKSAQSTLGDKRRAAFRLSCGLVAALIGSGAVVMFAIIKPRLGQRSDA